MAGTVIKMSGHHEQGIKDLAGILKWNLKADLVSESCQDFGDAAVILLCFEKFYWRVGSYASLTVMLTEHETEQTADLIGFGGGSSMVNFDYGANTNFAKLAKKLLIENGFQE